MTSLHLTIPLWWNATWSWVWYLSIHTVSKEQHRKSLGGILEFSPPHLHYALHHIHAYHSVLTTPLSRDISIYSETMRTSGPKARVITGEETVGRVRLHFPPWEPCSSCSILSCLPSLLRTGSHSRHTRARQGAAWDRLQTFVGKHSSLCPELHSVSTWFFSFRSHLNLPSLGNYSAPQDQSRSLSYPRHLIFNSLQDHLSTSIIIPICFSMSTH